MLLSVFALLVCALALPLRQAARVICTTTSVNIRSGFGTHQAIVLRAEQGERFVQRGDVAFADGLEWTMVTRCGSTTILGWMAVQAKWQYDCECDSADVALPTASSGEATTAPAGAFPRWPLHFEPPTQCTGTTTAGAVALGLVLRRHFRQIYDVNEYACRPVSGSSALSEHAEGRAVDLVVPPGHASNLGLAEFLVKHADRLGVQSVVHNRRVWGYGRWYWRAYRGRNPHTDHVHAGLHWQGARGLTEAAAEATFAGTTPVPDDAEQPLFLQPPESNVECVRARIAVNVRRAPTRDSALQLVAFAGEQWLRESVRHGRWYEISNARGSGFAYGTFFEPCTSEINARSLSGADDVGDARVGDAPEPYLSDVVIGLAGGAAGAVLLVSLIILTVWCLRRRAGSKRHWLDMGPDPDEVDETARKDSPRDRSSASALPMAVTPVDDDFPLSVSPRSPRLALARVNAVGVPSGSGTIVTVSPTAPRRQLGSSAPSGMAPLRVAVLSRASAAAAAVAASATASGGGGGGSGRARGEGDTSPPRVARAESPPNASSGAAPATGRHRKRSDGDSAPRPASDLPIVGGNGAAATTTLSRTSATQFTRADGSEAPRSLPRNRSLVRAETVGSLMDAKSDAKASSSEASGMNRSGSAHSLLE